MIAEFWDAVAVGSDHNLYVFFTDKRQPPCCVQLPPLPVSFFFSPTSSKKTPSLNILLG